ncbi:MAG: helix-turn-helix domain-containing protein [Halothiobacillaceae bacterium]
MSSIGERLRAERDRLGLNQEAFGALGGVNRNSQANYEKGSRTPDADYLASISESGVDVLFVVTGVRKPVSEGSLTEGEAEVLEHYRTMSEPDREAVKRMTSALASSFKNQALS